MLVTSVIWKLCWVATTCRAVQAIEELFTHSYCPPVPEGDTGFVSFYIDDKVNISAHRLLIFVKRNEGPDILHCYHMPLAPGVHCTVVNDRFKTKGLVGEKLTLVIPNATETVQGVYVLRVMPQEISRHHVDCNFTILKTGDDRTDQDQINRDVTIVLVVFGLLFGLLMIWILRRRQYCSWCGKKSARTHGSPGSKIYGKATEPPSAERENESLMAPEANDSEERNVTTTSSDSIAVLHTESEDCDVVQLLSPEDSSNNPTQEENQTVKPDSSTADQANEMPNNTLASKTGLHPESETNNPTQEENQTVKPDSSTTDQAKEMPNDTLTSKTGLHPESETRYRDEMILRIDERSKLLHRGPGAFLIRESKTDPEAYMLAVNYEEQVEYFTITKCGHSFVFEATNNSFNSLAELVQYYTEHEIRTTGGGVYCKLSGPCSDNQKEENSQIHKNHQSGQPQSPSAYQEQTEVPLTSTKEAKSEELVGEKMPRRKENKLLRSCGQGSFRITRNEKTQKNYTLAVFCNDKVTHFEIAPHNSKFCFLETGKDFECLSELVAHYKKHDIRVSKGILYCKLTTLCTSGPEDDGQKWRKKYATTNK